MRILVIAPQPFYQERGTPIATRLLIETLQSAGHSVDVLTYHVGDDPHLPGVRVFRAPAVPFVRDVPIGFSVRKILCDLMLGWRLLSLTRQIRYDVLHAVEEAVFLSLLVRVRGSRIVYDMDSSLPEQLVGKYRALRGLDGLLRRLERLAIARSDLVLAVCEDLATRARGYETTTPVDVVEDVSMLADGTASGDVEDLRSRSSGARRARHVCRQSRALPRRRPAARRNRNARHGDAAESRRDRRYTPPTSPRTDSARATLGISATVTFVGARPLKELGAYLAQADVLVSPRSSGQNTPMKLYSYLAAGKAVLATRIRSHTQVLTDDCALLVEPTGPALADGLDALLRSPALRAQLGGAAHRLAATRYSLTQFRKAVANAYRRLAAAPSGNA